MNILIPYLQFIYILRLYNNLIIYIISINYIITKFYSYYLETCLLQNKDFTGDDIKCVQRESAESCQKLCQQTEQCRKFSYITNTYDGNAKRRDCCLKRNGKMFPIDNVGIISGPRYCNGKFTFFVTVEIP